MTITTITIETVGYVSYASLAEADALLNVDPVRETTWEVLSDDEKGKRLVNATRRLDLLTWQGTKTGAEDVQLNQWPRTGLVYPDGVAVSTVEVPQEVEDATILLAGSIAITAAAADAGTSGTNVKSVKAGSAQVQFFRQQAGKPLQDETAFKLVLQWLEASTTSASLGPLATGADEDSTFADVDQWGVTRGFP